MPTLIIPSSPPSLQLGIDLLFLSTTSPSDLLGIKLIPPGVHLVHVTDPLSNIRVGQFIRLDTDQFATLIIDTTDQLSIRIVASNYPPSNQDYLLKMVPYQTDYPDQVFHNLQYSQYLTNHNGFVTSDDPSTLELRKVDDAILKNDPTNELLSQSLAKLNNTQLKLTVIDLSDKHTLIRKGGTDADKMNDYLDRTWLIKRAFKGEGEEEEQGQGQGQAADSDNGYMERFLAEFKFCFVMMVIMNNHGAYLQWKVLLDLFLNSVKGIWNEQTAASNELLEVFKVQLSVIGKMGGSDGDKEGGENAWEQADGQEGDQADQAWGQEGDPTGHTAHQAADQEQFSVDIAELQTSFKDCLISMDQVKDITLRFRYNEIIQILNTRFGMDVGDELGCEWGDE